jgi:hypothetical protein
MADDEIERDDEDFGYDYLYDEIGPQYADEHGDRITRERQTSNVADAALAAHYESIDAAEEQLRKAREQLDAGACEGAVFHASRALDGYATDVFGKPFRTLALVPFQEAFPHVKIKHDAIFSEVTGLENGAKFVYIGIAATAERNEAMQLSGAFKTFLKKPTADNPVTWSIRNATLHSLSNPSPDDARQFVEKVAALVERLSAPLKRMAAKAEAAEQEAKQKIADSRAYKTFGDE